VRSETIFPWNGQLPWASPHGTPAKYHLPLKWSSNASFADWGGELPDHLKLPGEEKSLPNPWGKPQRLFFSGTLIFYDYVGIKDNYKLI
jgi:hypothetical protein